MQQEAADHAAASGTIERVDDRDAARPGIYAASQHAATTSWVKTVVRDLGREPASVTDPCRELRPGAPTHPEIAEELRLFGVTHLREIMARRAAG